jgi:hypothetical protein
MTIRLDVDYLLLLAGDQMEPEEKIWGAVIALAAMDASRGDEWALKWLNERGGMMEYLCRGIFDLHQSWIVGKVEQKWVAGVAGAAGNGKRPRLIERDTGRNQPCVRKTRIVDIEDISVGECKRSARRGGGDRSRFENKS